MRAHGRKVFRQGWALSQLQVVALSGLALVPCLPVGAQDALRLALANQGGRQQEIENQPYTFRWGEFRLLTTASMGTEFNDNVNLVQKDPQQDIILRPLVNMSALWPVTELNSLSFSIGAGYEKFISHDQYDRALITPDSQLGWNIRIKDFQINLHDQFSYQEDPTVWGAVSGSARAGGFYNTVGFLGTWDLRDVVLSAGYDHFNFISSSSRYEYLTRASDFGLLRGAVRVHPSAIVGLEASAGPTTYDIPLLSDNFSYSIGTFAEWQVSEHMKLSPRGGYYLYSFADEGYIGRGTEQNGYYVNLTFSHDLRRSVSYSLDVGREAYMGNYSALTEQWYGAVYINWKIIKQVSFSTGLRYEMATQPVGTTSDDYDRLSFTMRLSCPIKPKLVTSVEYKYWLRSSQQSSAYDYTQNRLTLQVAYTF